MLPDLGPQFVLGYFVQQNRDLGGESASAVSPPQWPSGDTLAGWERLGLLSGQPDLSPAMPALTCARAVVPTCIVTQPH